MGGLTINEEPQATGRKVKLGRNLYLNAARDRIVEEGDPEAAFVYGRAHHEKPVAELERLGVSVEGPRAEKQSPPTADKDASEREDKAELDEAPDYGSMNYRDLQAACKERDLDATGKAEELIERLKGE